MASSSTPPDPFVAPAKEKASGETTTQHPGMRAPTPMPSSSLPVIHVEHGADPNAELELEESLGQGGMGRVFSARQKALQRTVAAKFLKESYADAGALMREAIVTGRLEHPSIVPVYALAKTTQGTPFFTMKRIEGTPWSEALARGGSLIEHLEVLQRTCDAVAFAHSRGVIHRDIKPSNILLGGFGEVYLVDWGLAASLQPDTVLPLARDVGVGGTPAYAAPEMATPGGDVGPWTDVFLLGATLHEVLMRRPPYAMRSVDEALKLAAEADPPALDPSVPAELASICRRAMHRDPKQRFGSAQDFKAELTSYLRHREVLELHTVALERLAALEHAASERGSESRHGTSLQPLYIECRLAFEQVRRLWPELTAARNGRERATALMVRHELDRGFPRAARLLLAELESAPPELKAAVEAAEQQEAEAATRAAALEVHVRERSPDAANDLKARYAGLTALAVLALSVTAQSLQSFGVVEFKTVVGVPFAVLLFTNNVLYMAWLFRDPSANRVQRQISIALTGLNVLALLGWLLAWRMGVGFVAAFAFYHLVNAAGWWTASMTLERRAVVMVGGFSGAAVTCWALPQWAPLSGVWVAIGFGLLARALATLRGDSDLSARSERL